MTDHMKVFHVVELCSGSIYHRGETAEARAVWGMGIKAQHDGPAFHSGFFFPDEIGDHIAAQEKSRGKKSLAGYRGKHWSPYMLLDIDPTKDPDGKVANPEIAKGMADDVLRVLTEHLGVDVTMTLICFSGNKGYHIYVPTKYFDPEPGEDFSKRIRHMVEFGIWPKLNQTLFPTVKELDWSIYDTIKVYRAINSKHEKSGLWKIPLSPSEFQKMTFAEVKAFAEEPRPANGTPRPGVDPYVFPDWRKVQPSAELRELWNLSTRWREDRRKAFASTDRKLCDLTEISNVDPKQIPDRRLCAMKLSQIDVGHGNRNQATLMLISDLRDQGFTPDQAFEFMKPWLVMQKGTAKTEQYLADQVRYVYEQGFSWGCFSPLAATHCFKQCRWYPHAEEERKNAAEWVQMDVYWERYVERVKTPVYYTFPFGELHSKLRLRSKQANLFIGETASGKTAISMAFLQHLSNVIDNLRATVFDFRSRVAMVSLEMPGEELAERQAQRVLMQDQTFVENVVRRHLQAELDGTKDQFYEETVRDVLESMKNVYFYDGVGLNLRGLRELLKAGKEQHGIDFVIIDFMDRIVSKGMNQYERLAPIAVEMKSIARELDIQIWTLVQVSRSESDKGSLGLRSARGSGQLEENSDTLITYEQVSKQLREELGLPEPQPGEKYMRLRSPKVRGGAPDGVALLKFIGSTMTFEDITPTETRDLQILRNHE